MYTHYLMFDTCVYQIHFGLCDKDQILSFFLHFTIWFFHLILNTAHHTETETETEIETSENPLKTELDTNKVAEYMDNHMFPVFY